MNTYCKYPAVFLMAGTLQNRDFSSTPALRGLIRDFNDALIQQMYFWGRDVIHPDGNLLCEFGFERRASEGLDGTSCYRMPYEDGMIELHGACVGRYEKSSPGFLFIRNRHSSFLFEGAEPPAPGLYSDSSLRSDPLTELYEASCRFLSWWLQYESWIKAEYEAAYRDRCFRAFRKLPRSKPWLRPAEGEDWLRRYARDPKGMRRAKHVRKKGSAWS